MVFLCQTLLDVRARWTDLLFSGSHSVEWMQHLLHVISASHLGFWKSFFFFFVISSRCLPITYPSRSSQRVPSPAGIAVLHCGLSAYSQDTRVNSGWWSSTKEEKWSSPKFYTTDIRCLYPKSWGYLILFNSLNSFKYTANFLNHIWVYVP